MNYVIHTTFDRMIIQILCKLVKIPWRPVQSHSNPIKIPLNPMKSSFLSNEVPLNPIKIPWNPTKSHGILIFQNPQRIQFLSPRIEASAGSPRATSPRSRPLTKTSWLRRRQETCQGGAPSDKCVIIPWKHMKTTDISANILSINHIV